MKGRKGLAVFALLAVVGGLAAGAVVYILRIQGERQYRQLLATGEQALSDGNLYGAIEAFSGALVLRPTSMVAFYRRGEAYRAQNQELEAVANFRQANRLAPNAPQPLVALGDLYDAKSDFGQAAFWFGEAADRLKDEDPALLYRLALSRYKAGAPATAIDPLKRAIARNDMFAPAHYLLGLVHRDARNFEAARVSIEQAVKLDPGFTAAREELADLYRAESRTVEEIQQLQALAARDGSVARKMAIGLAEARNGQFDGAIGTLTGALAAAPNDPRVQIALARAYLGRAEHTRDRESLTRATTMLERALGGRARRSEGLALYGRAIYLSGDLTGAERLLREAVATTPVDLEAFRSLAEVAERLSHDIVARDALVNLEALEGDTASAGVRASRARRIGDLSLRAGDAKTAATYLEQAVEAGIRDSGTLGQLARARWLSGNGDGAREALNQALELAPRDPELLRIGRMIR